MIKATSMKLRNNNKSIDFNNPYINEHSSLRNDLVNNSEEYERD